MEKVDRYQLIHPDGTKLSPVDMAMLTDMVYAGIVKADTSLFVVASQRVVSAAEIPYIAFLLNKLKDSTIAPPAAPMRRVGDRPSPSSPQRRSSDQRPPAPTPEPAVPEPPIPEVPPTQERSPMRPLPEQTRAYIAFAAVALVLLLGGGICQSLARAQARREREELLGSWQIPDGTRLVFKPDGTGAITRPDPLYGNRTHLFHWERRGEQLYLTQKRILLPGGSRQTAKDSVETISLHPDGSQLSLGKLSLQKEP
jgi:hypothetical protein